MHVTSPDYLYNFDERLGSHHVVVECQILFGRLNVALHDLLLQPAVG